ncbi:MAG: hypothetical protein ABSA76_10125 [Bacteroidales bacterium]
MKLKSLNIWLNERLRILVLFFIATLFLPTCIEETVIDKNIEAKPYAALEKQIRDENDSRAVFTWDQYTQLMTVLSDKKFMVLPLNEMRKTFDSTAVVVGLRHDIDVHPFKALEMADIEKSFKFRATYFVLATAEYYGTVSNGVIKRRPEMDYVYKELYEKGTEIGIHNDLLAIMITYNIDPLKFTLDEINHYASLGIPIYGTAAHGSQIAKDLNVSNFEMFSDFATRDSVTYNGQKYPVGKYNLKECGFEYEAYHIPYYHYYSESGGRWNDPMGFNGILDKIKSSIPGDRIQILMHPVWWGKK